MAVIGWVLSGYRAVMRTLDSDQVRAALPMSRAIESMRAAFGRDRETPARIALGVSLFMPGRIGGITGVKVVSTVPGNPVGMVAVFGPDGSPLGIVDGPTLTAIRTGAGCGLMTDLLAPRSASVLAILGAGAMAFDQIDAVRSVRALTRILVWSRTPDRAADLAARVDGEVAATADEAVAAADIVTTATPSTSPLFAPDSVRRGTHINAVGAFTPEMAEIPGDVVRSAFVVVDDFEAAAVEAGDLIQAGKRPDGSAADVLEGLRPAAGATTMFKSVGISSQDVAAAAAALEGAGS